MKSFRRVLFVRYAVAATLAVAAIAVILIFPLRSYVIGEQKKQLLIEAGNLAALVAPYFEDGRSTEISGLFKAPSISREQRLTVIDSKGVVLGDSEADPATMDNHAGRPEVRAALEGGDSVIMRRSATVGKDLLYAAVPVEINGRVAGVARVAVEQSNLARAYLTSWLIMIAGLVLLLALLFGVTYWTGKTLAADLGEIESGLEKIVLENELDRMPLPRLAETFDLARDLEVIGERVNTNYRMLEAERDKLEAILLNIGAGIIVVGPDGRIELINPAARRILGIDEKDALGRSPIELHPTGVIDRAVERSFGGETIADEVEIRSPRRRVVKVLAGPVRSARGEVVRVICVLDDVTATRRLERMRRDFVANVSHELRTPVANFRATVDALLEGALEDGDKAVGFLKNLDRESDRMMTIITDLLTLSKLESDGFLLSREPFSVGEMLDEVVREKKELAERGGVVLEHEPVPEGLKVLGDRELIKTACLNLVDNAVKYNRAGGSVYVRVEVEDGRIAVVVEDTGVGIPEKDRAKVFERFYRVDRARSRETGGTGLGLSIVRHIADLHGGSVSLQSVEGQGSVFRLEVPGA